MIGGYYWLIPAIALAAVIVALVLIERP